MNNNEIQHDDENNKNNDKYSSNKNNNNKSMKVTQTRMLLKIINLSNCNLYQSLN